MSDELSEDETAALLRDLESRASGKKSAAAEDDDEDLEAFLKRLDAQDAKPAPTRVRDPLEDQFAALEDAPAANIVKAPTTAPQKAEKPAKDAKTKDVNAKEAKVGDGPAATEDAKKATAIKVVERGESRGLAIAMAVSKVLLVMVPFLVATWVMGTFLAQWVSAGWLIALVVLVAVTGLSFGVRSVAKRGKYRWWLAGTSAALTAVLLAASPTGAAGVLASYGHWPASAVAAAAGWSPDHFTVRGAQWVADALARQLDPLVKATAYRLGTTTPLSVTDAAAPPQAPTPDAAPVEGEPKTPDVPEKTPEPPTTNQPPTPADPASTNPAN